MATESDQPPGQNAGRPILGEEVLEKHSVTISPLNWLWLGRAANDRNRSRSQILDQLVRDARIASIGTLSRTESAHEQQQLPSASAGSFNPPPTPKTGKVPDLMKGLEDSVTAAKKRRTGLTHQMKQGTSGSFICSVCHQPKGTASEFCPGPTDDGRF